MEKIAIKIAFYLNKGKQPKWIEMLVSWAMKSDHIKIVHAVYIKTNPNAENFQGISKICYQLHEKIDHLLYAPKKSLSERTNIEYLITLANENSITDINNEDVDLVLNLTSFDHPHLALAPRFGIWSLGQNFSVPSHTAPGYWQTTQRHPETVTTLWYSKATPTNRWLLDISSQITDYHAINKNREKYHKRALLIITRALDRVASDGEDYISRQIEKNRAKEKDYFQALSIRHSLWQVMKNFGRQLNTLLCSLYINVFFLDHWFVMFQLKTTTSNVMAFASYLPIVSPKDRFWADPYVVSRNNYHYIFVEEWLYANTHAHLAVLKLDKNGELMEHKPILETSYHLSYPYIFQHRGVDYMIPETRENGTIDLYRCLDFPYYWEFVKTLKDDIQAVDTTPFYHQDKWWIFCNVDQGDGQSSINDELFLYFCDDLFEDEWMSHPMNPIVSDVKNARPAGKIFKKDGKIFRPSQDSAKCYGRSLNINQIVVLSETEYREVQISKIESNWEEKLKRMHTYNFNSKIAVIDSFYYKRK